MEKPHFIQYVNPDVLLVVNRMGLLKIIYTPFRVQCVSQIGNFRAGTFVFVDEVASAPGDKLLYIIGSRPYLHTHFVIRIHF